MGMRERMTGDGDEEREDYLVMGMMKERTAW